MFDEVQLMRFLQFAFAATIVFDAFVAFWVLLAGRADRRLARIYFMTFGVIVLWELMMYLGIFTSFQGVVGVIIDMASFAIGSIGAFLLFYFIWCVLEKKQFSKFGVVILCINSLLFFILCFIPNFVLGTKLYLDNHVYNQIINPGKFTSR